MPFLIESAATGSSAYLWLTERDPSPWTMANLSGGLEHPDSNPIWKLLATAPYRERLELQPPGYWTWRDEYHPNAGGQLLGLFAVWILVELFRKERLNWPWIAAFLLPLLALITSTWALPITGPALRRWPAPRLRARTARGKSRLRFCRGRARHHLRVAFAHAPLLLSHPHAHHVEPPGMAHAAR